MLFLNHVKHYILFILLIDLVKISLSTKKGALTEDGRKRSSRKKNHPPPNDKSKKKNSKKVEQPPVSRHDRVDRLRKQLYVGAYERKSYFSDSKKQSSVMKSLENSNELRKKLSTTNSRQIRHESRRHSNLTTGQLTFQRPYRRPSQHTRRRKVHLCWNCFG